MPEPATDTRAFLHQASDHAHWLIQLADTKASYLMAAGAILAGLLAQQAGFGCSDLARFTVFLAIAFALGTAAATLLVLFPRTASQVPGNLLYFTDIEGFKSGADYFERVHAMTSEDTDRAIAHQVWELARTQNRKFYWLRWAFRFFGLCLVATLVGVVWAHLPCG
jgi:hypothetical protein